MYSNLAEQWDDYYDEWPPAAVETVEAREIVCGLSYLDIIRVATEYKHLPESAVRLGVSKSYLWEICRERGMLHWFSRSEAPRGFKSKLSRKRLLYYAKLGYTIKDTAAAVGMSKRQVHTMIQRHGLRGMFPNPGEGSWLARTGEQTKLNREQLARYGHDGYTIKGTAAALEMSYSHVAKKIKQLGLRELFPNAGDAAWQSRREAA